MLTSGDPIFKKKKRSWWPVWLLVPVLAYYLHHFTREDPSEVIAFNQKQAQKHMKEILVALKKWHRNDYDANGRADYPLLNLSELVEKRFINGEKFELISEELARADLRSSEAIPMDGYYFTLTHWEKQWPATGMVKEVQILAIPAELGITGSCWFYINTEGQAYYSNFSLRKQVPRWPDARQLEAGVWKELPFGP